MVFKSVNCLANGTASYCVAIIMNRKAHAQHVLHIQG